MEIFGSKIADGSKMYDKITIKIKQYLYVVFVKQFKLT